MNRSTLRSGFSLLEVIVVVAILSIVAGAAVPVALKGLTSKARKVTQDELRDLSGAVVEYFRDTLVLPSDLADLEVTPVPAVPGWTGPYLPGAVADTLSGTSGYQVDAWSRAYDYDVTGDLVTISSLGQDALRRTFDPGSHGGVAAGRTCHSKHLENVTARCLELTRRGGEAGRRD
ncbi:MAG: prepilin-type N-terminal cleavage/methylation domain-containing protein, partial [Planctomycetota bacterium]